MEDIAVALISGAVTLAGVMAANLDLLVGSVVLTPEWHTLFSFCFSTFSLKRI